MALQARRRLAITTSLRVLCIQQGRLLEGGTPKSLGKKAMRAGFRPQEFVFTKKQTPNERLKVPNVTRTNKVDLKEIIVEPRSVLGRQQEPIELAMLAAAVEATSAIGAHLMRDAITL